MPVNTTVQGYLFLPSLGCHAAGNAKAADRGQQVKISGNSSLPGQDPPQSERALLETRQRGKEGLQALNMLPFYNAICIR